MENKICQSCGMPITSNEQLGTNKYGSQAGMTNEKMKEYCEKMFPTLKRWKVD